MTTSHGRWACGAALLVVLAGPAGAEDVQMFDHPPSLQELRDALVPEHAGGTEPGAGATGRRGGLTRSVVLKPTAPPEGDPAAAPAAAAPLPATTSSTPAPRPVGLPVQFGYNSAEVMAGSRAYLDQMGRLMQAEPSLRLMIEGHTDAAGSADYNLDLSERRALAARRYLIAAYDIAPSRLDVIGYGKDRPINRLDPYAAVNRRVQFRRQE